MAQTTSWRPGISKRAKNILNMITSEPITSEHKKKLSKNIDETTLVNELNAQPYSMSGPIFDSFCETQTSYNSFYIADLSVFKENFPIKQNLSETHTDLTCKEILVFSPEKSPIPPSPIFFDFDSDDSVRDKDYKQPEIESSDSDDDLDIFPTTKKPVKVTAIETTQQKSKPRHLFKNRIPQRRITIEYIRPEKLHSQPRKRRLTADGMSNQLQLCENLCDLEEPQKKRKKYSTTLAQRKLEAKMKKRIEYSVKQGCNEKCAKKCTTNFDEENRKKINEHFWTLTWPQRHAFVELNTSVAIPKRKYATEPQRNPKRNFNFKNEDGVNESVCKIFFLTTLGFKKTNDRILYPSVTETGADKRGKHIKTLSFDRDLLTQHVESFHPAEPHYRREHAPLRRYIPSDINIASMHKDFNAKHPNVSYEVYRKHVKQMNISFTRLGNEECESCETYMLHKQQSSHDAIVEVTADCNTCVEWVQHHQRYTKARELYQSHKEMPQDETQIFVSSDLEKVIMLPRMDSFKAVIFCPRLVAYNQTFAPLGKITNNCKPITAIWHDAIAGRKQEDIMSAFYSFFQNKRDVKNIHVWLDNCTAQNKNWLLFSLLVHLVNSDLIAAEIITLYYFEPGHTFMSCDQVHHQVEVAMKKKGKLYDFVDFEDAVGSINNSKVVVKSLAPENFINVPNFISDRRIQNSNPRAYLKNMSQVCFQRNNFDLVYKNDFNEQYTTLRFMNDKFLKNPANMKVTFRSSPKGIEPERKAGLLDKLSAIIPTHKLLFWQNLPTTNNYQSSNTNNRKTT